MENLGAESANKQSGAINFGPLFIAIAATTWTMDFISRNIVLEVMSATMLVLFEHLIMTIIVLPILWRSRYLISQFNSKEWIALIIIGVGASGLATVALSTGYALGFFQYAPVVALTQQLQPVIAIGLAHYTLKENLPTYYYPLSLTAIIGVFLMYYPTVSGFNTGLIDNLGLQAAFYGLIAAVLWGSGTVLGKYMLVHSETDIKHMEMASFRFIIGLIGLIIFNISLAFFKGFNSIAVDIAAINLRITQHILFLALVPGLFALVLYYYGLKSTHASVATLFELAFPLSFFVFVPLLTGVSILPIQFVGAGILIVSTTILSYIYGKQTTPDQFEETDETAQKLLV